MKETKEISYLDYMDKTFLEELNYKIWSTKGARFNANIRLLKISNYSNLCGSLISVYLIAMSLLSVYNIYDSNQLNDNVIAYSITCLSILLLVFTQTENSKHYKQKAKEFHDCGLELSGLYNRLRIFKTMKTNPDESTREEFALGISEDYQKILEKQDNHDAIDIHLFKADKPNYHKYDNLDVWRVKIQYYFKTSFFYQCLIVLPPLAIILLILNN